MGTELLTFPPASLFIMPCHKVRAEHLLASYRLKFSHGARKQDSYLCQSVASVLGSVRRVNKEIYMRRAFQVICFIIMTLYFLHFVFSPVSQLFFQHSGESGISHHPLSEFLSQTWRYLNSLLG